MTFTLTGLNTSYTHGSFYDEVENLIAVAENTYLYNGNMSYLNVHVDGATIKVPEGFVFEQQ